MDMEPSEGQSWSGLERDLMKIPGALRVRVEGNDEPTLVHLVAETNQPVDELARAVRTVAATSNIDLTNDVISIVQLESSAAAGLNGDEHRIVLDSVVVATKPTGGWAKLNLRLPNGDLSEGAAPISHSKDARARAGVVALIDALQEPISKLNARLELKNLFVQDMYQEGFVVVQVLFSRNGENVTLTGSATIGDDMAAAGAKATLHALNRKLRMATLEHGHAL